MAAGAAQRAGNRCRRAGRGRRAALIAVLLAGTAAAGCAPAPSAGPLAPAEEIYPPAGRPVRSSLLPPPLSDADRDRLDEARRVAELLLITPGQRIAELEAGTGYFAIRLARALGPAGGVVATEADPADAAAIGRRAASLELPWLTVLPSLADDPRLPPNAADVVIIGDGYATIGEPYAYLHRLARAMPPHGRLAVIASDTDLRLGGIPAAVVRCEAEAVGFRLLALHRLLPADRYLALFEPPDPVPAADGISACDFRGVPGVER